MRSFPRLVLSGLLAVLGVIGDVWQPVTVFVGGVVAIVGACGLAATLWGLWPALLAGGLLCAAGALLWGSLPQVSLPTDEKDVP